MNSSGAFLNLGLFDGRHKNAKALRPQLLGLKWQWPSAAFGWTVGSHKQSLRFVQVERSGTRSAKPSAARRGAGWNPAKGNRLEGGYTLLLTCHCIAHAV